MADVTVNAHTSNTVERNGSVVVGAPRGDNRIGGNYVLGVEGRQATATVTFSAAAVTLNQTIVIIDTAGTSKTYTAKNSSTVASLQFIKTGAAAAATALKACIDHANGHNGTIVVDDDLAGKLTLTQAVGGLGGNSTVTTNLTSVTVAGRDGTADEFTGGTSGGMGVNNADDVAVMDSRWDARFDDLNYAGLAE